MVRRAAIAFLLAWLVTVLKSLWWMIPNIINRKGVEIWKMELLICTYQVHENSTKIQLLTSLMQYFEVTEPCNVWKDMIILMTDGQ